MEKSVIPEKDIMKRYHQSQEALSRDFSEHSDLEPFLMTAEELESQHAHDLHYRQSLHQLKKSV